MLSERNSGRAGTEARGKLSARPSTSLYFPTKMKNAAAGPFGRGDFQRVRQASFADMTYPLGLSSNYE
jgi:hypothetical protein